MLDFRRKYTLLRKTTKKYVKPILSSDQREFKFVPCASICVFFKSTITAEGFIANITPIVSSSFMHSIYGVVESDGGNPQWKIHSFYLIFTCKLALVRRKDGLDVFSSRFS